MTDSVMRHATIAIAMNSSKKFCEKITELSPASNFLQSEMHYLNPRPKAKEERNK